MIHLRIRYYTLSAVRVYVVAENKYTSEQHPLLTSEKRRYFFNKHVLTYLQYIYGLIPVNRFIPINPMLYSRFVMTVCKSVYSVFTYPSFSIKSRQYDSVLMICSDIVLFCFTLIFDQLFRVCL